MGLSDNCGYDQELGKCDLNYLGNVQPYLQILNDAANVPGV
jgi:hypothetical protein